eukprot:SAG31_NODE_545_length_14238_cov_15.518849_2_plen_100_part_00
MESTQSSQRGQNTGTVSVDADESEYEDLYFVLELPGLSSQFLANCDDYAVIGLDTPTPMLQLGRSTFRGRHEEQLGRSPAPTPQLDALAWIDLTLSDGG